MIELFLSAPELIPMNYVFALFFVPELIPVNEKKMRLGIFKKFP